MFTEVSTIIALLALGAFGWWLYQSRAAVRRKREEEGRDFERHDHSRAHETAKLQSEVQKWQGQW